MSLGLLLPFGLAALAGLILPLLIHLVRRPEQTPYDFPALRWLRESERPRRRLRFDDLLLLVLRLILIGLLALLLAVPVVTGEWRAPRHWVLASTAIDLDAAHTVVSDEQAEWRWLAPGFPGIEDARPALEQPLASLLREFEVGIPPSDSLTVLVPPETGGLDAERIALGRSVAWDVVPAAVEPENAEAESKPAGIAVRHAGESEVALRHVRAALDALAESEPDHWQVDDKSSLVPVDASSDAVIWLDGKLPDELLPWVESGGRAITVEPQSASGAVILRDEGGSVVAREQVIGDGAIVRFVQPLAPDSLPMLLDAEFPARLRELLVGVRPPPTRAFAAEVAPVAIDRAMPLPATPLSALLCLLIAFVFLIERVVATRRQRSA
jgi:hypothetical protein